MAVRGKDLVTWGLLALIAWELTRDGSGIFGGESFAGGEEGMPAGGAAGSSGGCCCQSSYLGLGSSRYAGSMTSISTPTWLRPRTATMQPFTFNS